MASHAAEPNTLVSIIDVSYFYGNNHVLDRVSLNIRKGDFLAVIGPNGSGKTTLIKIMLGLLNPGQGEVKLFGKLLREFADWGKIGYVPQKATHFDPFFPISVKEVVSLGLIANRNFAFISKPEEEQAVTKALCRVDMNHLIHKRIGSLSSGQQQRVFIARAIVSDPDILILDEPTTGVDVGMHDRFFDMLNVLHKENNMTIVLITHEIGIINKHISQVACLNQKLTYHGKHSDFCNSEAFKKMISGGHHIISHHH